MANYTEPSQDGFNDAEQAVLDVLSTRFPGMNVKAGSVLRELLVRPMAYLYSWCRASLSGLRKESGMAYLKTSQATENPVADEVAAGYFVERRGSTPSRGVVTLTMQGGYIRIPKGSRFDVGGSVLVTDTPVIGSSGVESGLRDGVMYSRAVGLSDGTYSVGVPVVADSAGRLEIPAGSDAEPMFGETAVLSAVLTSAVTGGMDAETDAQMMARCEYAVASADTGSYYGMLKKLQKAPVNVLGIGLVAGEDKEIHRARNNSLGINPGGIVDCYVRTQDQHSTITLEASSVSAGEAVFDLTGHEGAYGIGWLKIDGTPVAETALVDDVPYAKWTVEFGSSSSLYDGMGARLGIFQTLTVRCDDILADSVVTASVNYMPGIADLQSFIDREDQRIVGLDVQMKAAIPATMKIDVVVRSGRELDETDLRALRRAMADSVNSVRIGAGVVNFSDLRDACAEAVPDAELRLPCNMSAEVFMRDGSLERLSSNTGMLNIRHPVDTNSWDPSVVFFCLPEENIRIDLQ